MKVQIAVNIIRDVLVNISAGLIASSWFYPAIKLERKVKLKITLNSIMMAMVLLEVTYIMQVI